MWFLAGWINYISRHVWIVSYSGWQWDSSRVQQNVCLNIHCLTIVSFQVLLQGSVQIWHQYHIVTVESTEQRISETEVNRAPHGCRMLQREQQEIKKNESSAVVEKIPDPICTSQRTSRATHKSSDTFFSQLLVDFLLPIFELCHFNESTLDVIWPFFHDVLNYKLVLILLIRAAICLKSR
jgi:hypothetical protein